MFIPLIIKMAFRIIYSQLSKNRMGYGLKLFDQSISHTEQMIQQQQDRQQQRCHSIQIAEMYAFYQQLIKQTARKYPSSAQKLALSLILSRGNKPTVTKNRELNLLDIDKIISMNKKSIKEEGIRFQNMRMAVDLSGIKANQIGIFQNINENVERGDENQRGNFQIFRLVRAAQHYFALTRRPDQPENNDVVNTSFNQEQ